MLNDVNRFSGEHFVVFDFGVNVDNVREMGEHCDEGEFEDVDEVVGESELLLVGDVVS